MVSAESRVAYSDDEGLIEDDRRDGRPPLTAFDPEAAGIIQLDALRPVDRAYDGIRNAILTGVLKPGDHLREEQLAAMTGTSRTPVREALRRLVAEENRHRFVTDFSYEEVVIVFEIRAKLESYAAGVAAQKITSGDLDRLEELIHDIDRIDPAGGGPSATRFIELNADFHRIIVEATRSRQIKALSAQAVALPLVLIKQFVWDQRIDIVRSNHQHRDILAALRQRNSEWAATAMSGHILSTKPRPRDGGNSRR